MTLIAYSHTASGINIRHFVFIGDSSRLEVKHIHRARSCGSLAMRSLSITRNDERNDMIRIYDAS